jgi:hypothetical protein
MQSSPLDDASIRILTEMVRITLCPHSHMRPALIHYLTSIDALPSQGFDESDAADALSRTGGEGVEAAVALLLARDHQEHIVSSMRGPGVTSDSSGITRGVSSSSPAVLSSSQQFSAHVSDIESDRQVEVL